jgi:hypothetical protein
MDGHYATNSRELPKNGSVKVRIQMLEEALNQQFSIVTGQSVCVSGPMLKRNPDELAKKLGHNDFKAADGWLSQWKCRFGIKFKKAHGKDSADAVSGEQWKSIKLPNLLQKFCADNFLRNGQ